MALVSWVRGSINKVNLEALREHARASILDVNDGITSAAGIAEGFISAGASTRTMLLAGTAVILAGGSAAAGARYSEVRTKWEMDRAMLEAERASIEADPAGEFEELVGIYEAKGLSPGLARQVAEALTELDPVAAHADAELRLEALGPTSGAVLAALTAGLCFGIGAVHVGGKIRAREQSNIGEFSSPALLQHLFPHRPVDFRPSADLTRRSENDFAGWAWRWTQPRSPAD